MGTSTTNQENRSALLHHLQDQDMNRVPPAATLRRLPRRHIQVLGQVLHLVTHQDHRTKEIVLKLAILVKIIQVKLQVDLAQIILVNVQVGQVAQFIQVNDQVDQLVQVTKVNVPVEQKDQIFLANDQADQLKVIQVKVGAIQDKERIIQDKAETIQDKAEITQGQEETSEVKLQVVPASDLERPDLYLTKLVLDPAALVLMMELMRAVTIRRFPVNQI